ncbi:hypothetical protein FHS43_003272 [Streptosporangium becharense]|uniref:Uncharacterized protein n=1 Tax=Streptosporangium becharense TaxID=1816182 RepID=A0A7W9ID60_9ACTN|nr:hypothetical protein [Streptosporangium becharense]MBB5818539.1 hypothetical protein [Streptosporangium becharense]
MAVSVPSPRYLRVMPGSGAPIGRTRVRGAEPPGKEEK